MERSIMSQNTFFDTRARDWEENCYPAPVRKRLQDLIGEFGVLPGTRVLDIGTGPGVLIPYLRRLIGKEGRICAFDLSLEMVRQAVTKPLSRRDMVLQADVHHMPFRSEVFDQVICFAAFPHFSDPARALREMSRVVLPGGSVVIAHLLR
jgi:ubiquinone/menaquinone biosynthesis C-methylase UbiE